MTDVRTVDNPAESRWEAWIGEDLAGIAVYQLTDQLVVFTHTEVDEAFEGRGVGSALARAALDGVRADGSRRVLPLCPFIKEWIGRHRDYIDLVYGAPPSTARD